MLEEYISEKGAVKVMVRYKKQRDRNNIAVLSLQVEGKWRQKAQIVVKWASGMPPWAAMLAMKQVGRTDPFVWQHRQDQGMQGRCRAGDTGKDLGGVHGKPESL